MKQKNVRKKKCLRYVRYLNKMTISENRKAIHNGVMVPQVLINHYNKGHWFP